MVYRRCKAGLQNLSHTKFKYFGPENVDAVLSAVLERSSSHWECLSNKLNCTANYSPACEDILLLWIPGTAVHQQTRSMYVRRIFGTPSTESIGVLAAKILGVIRSMSSTDGPNTANTGSMRSTYARVQVPAVQKSKYLECSEHREYSTPKYFSIRVKYSE